MTVTRLTGGLSPANGNDPRTFPEIWNATSDVIDASEAGLVSQGSRLSTAESDIQANEAAILLRAPLLLVENVRTANYTLQLSDVAAVVAVDSGSALTVTVPVNSSVEFPIGSVVNVYRAGSGAVDLVGASGVTVRNVGAISDQFGEVSLRKRDVNEWVLVGQVD